MSTAFEYAQAQHEHPSRDWTGWCLVFVRSCFGVPARYGSATEAWTKAEHKHRETDPNKIPRGVPVFWTGGSHGFGHIALSRGEGSCWTTDLIRRGHVDVARISDVHDCWGLTLAGWTEDVNGVRVWSPPTAKKSAKPAAKPATRGPNVDDAIGAAEKAHAYATQHHQTKRAGILAAALTHLRKLPRK